MHESSAKLAGAVSCQSVTKIHLFYCCCCRHGLNVQTKKYLDEMLMDNVLGFLNAQQNSSKPFYMFYAPHSIHT
jgi:hypothetical protein